MSERTLVLIKPDGVERGLVGEVISRIERKGLTLVALELRSSNWSSRRSTTSSTRARASTTACWSSSPVARWSRSSSRAPAPSPPSVSWPAAPTRSRRPRTAASAAISAWRPSSTWCTAPIRRSPPPGRSGSGSRAVTERVTLAERRATPPARLRPTTRTGSPVLPSTGPVPAAACRPTTPSVSLWSRCGSTSPRPAGRSVSRHRSSAAGGGGACGGTGRRDPHRPGDRGGGQPVAPADRRCAAPARAGAISSTPVTSSWCWSTRRIPGPGSAARCWPNCWTSPGNAGWSCWTSTLRTAPAWTHSSPGSASTMGSPAGLDPDRTRG